MFYLLIVLFDIEICNLTRLSLIESFHTAGLFQLNRNELTLLCIFIRSLRWKGLSIEFINSWKLSLIFVLSKISDILILLLQIICQKFHSYSYSCFSIFLKLSNIRSYASLYVRYLGITLLNILTTMHYISLSCNFYIFKYMNLTLQFLTNCMFLNRFSWKLQVYQDNQDLS